MFCWTVLLVALLSANVISLTSSSTHNRKLGGVEDRRSLTHHRTASLHHRRRHAAKLRLTEALDDDWFLLLLSDRFHGKPNRGRRQLANRLNERTEGTKNRIEIDPEILKLHLQSDVFNNGGGGGSPSNSRTQVDRPATSADASNPRNSGNNGSASVNAQQNHFRSSSYGQLANNASNINWRQRDFNSANTSNNMNMLGNRNSGSTIDLQSPLLTDDDQSRTISLSGQPAFNGNATENKKIWTLLTTELLGGFAIKKVKQFNDRTYLSKFRRNYWFGERYYRLDHDNFFETRDTCMYEMSAVERQGLAYEDGPSIHNIIFQCQRYVEVCCGLTCCYYGASSSIFTASGAMPFLLILSISTSLIRAVFHN